MAPRDGGVVDRRLRPKCALAAATCVSVRFHRVLWSTGERGIGTAEPGAQRLRAYAELRGEVVGLHGHQSAPAPASAPEPSSHRIRSRPRWSSARMERRSGAPGRDQATSAPGEDSGGDLDAAGTGDPVCWGARPSGWTPCDRDSRLVPPCNGHAGRPCSPDPFSLREVQPAQRPVIQCVRMRCPSYRARVAMSPMPAARLRVRSLDEWSRPCEFSSASS